LAYRAVATCESRCWLVHVVELDKYAQAKWTHSVVVELEIRLPTSVTERLRLASEQAEQAALLKGNSAENRRAAARELHKHGLTVREIGSTV
jgi:hypothetical protein